MTENTSQKKVQSRPRPLSPHLQVYKPQLTSVLSILHRATGVALYFGAYAFIAYLAYYSFVGGFDFLDFVQNTPIGQYIAIPVLFGYTFAVFYHLCNGIRHLFWDIGKGYELDAAYRSGRLVILTSFALTFGVWLTIIFN